MRIAALALVLVSVVVTPAWAQVTAKNGSRLSSLSKLPFEEAWEASRNLAPQRIKTVWGVLHVIPVSGWHSLGLVFVAQRKSALTLIGTWRFDCAGLGELAAVRVTAGRRRDERRIVGTAFDRPFRERCDDEPPDAGVGETCEDYWESIEEDSKTIFEVAVSPRGVEVVR